jgi:hypothetical protein
MSETSIKVLKPRCWARSGFSARSAPQPVAAPHLLPLFDSGEADGLYYDALCGGRHAARPMLAQAQLPVDETADHVAGAPNLPTRGIVHRDLKPENILLQAGQPVTPTLALRWPWRRPNERLTGTGCR